MQYIHKLEYGDSESITLNRAIEHYKKFVEEELKDGVKCPYWADLKNIERLEQKLFGIRLLEQSSTIDTYLSLDDLSKMVDEDYLFDKYVEYRIDLTDDFKKNLKFKDWYLDIYLKNRKL